MPDGPPWIAKATIDGSDFWGSQCFHLELDEHRRWILSAVVTRPAGNSYEISIDWNIPSGFNKPPHSVCSMNDSNPLTPLYQSKFWFANEDVFVSVTWKPQVDPSNDVWEASRPVSAKFYSDTPLSKNGRCVMNFEIATPKGEVIYIAATIACMFSRHEILTVNERSA